MYIEFDLPDTPPKPDAFAQYWLRSIFISSASPRYEINALATTYVRLVSAALVEYEEGSKCLRDFWGTHTSLNLSAMHRSISHFESCIFNANRATNCFRRLRGDRLHDPIALALRQKKFFFSQDTIADRIREMRNEIHHLEDSVLDGQITQGQDFTLRPDGPEVPHLTEENQTVKTIDRLVIGTHEILFRELVQWLQEMTEAVSKIAEVLPSSSPPPEEPNPSQPVIPPDMREKPRSPHNSGVLHGSLSQASSFRFVHRTDIAHKPATKRSILMSEACAKESGTSPLTLGISDKQTPPLDWSARNVYTSRIHNQVNPMTFARIFQSGNSQAVRLPKEFRLNVEQVEIFRRGDEIVLREVPVDATAIFDALASLPADFMADGRDDTPPQEREAL